MSLQKKSQQLSKLWGNDSTWLCLPENEWTVTEFDSKSDLPDVLEEPALWTTSNEFENLTSLYDIKLEAFTSLNDLYKATNKLKITDNCMDDAEIIWIKLVQKQHFSEILQNWNEKSHLKHQLGLFVHQICIVRAKGYHHHPMIMSFPFYFQMIVLQSYS